MDWNNAVLNEPVSNGLMEQDIRELNGVALDPANSVVIEACAGSGKTWLLVSRIVRLLLAGVRPSEILAITFTRKAAQEMQARLHQWLRFLATAEDAEVRRFLRDREVRDDQIDDLLPRARALFEEFLTDQPGITINTFHGWFLQLLKRAPLAAGVASGTNLVDQTSSLVNNAWELFAEGLQHRPRSPAALALNWLFETYGLPNTHSLLSAFLAKRAEWWAFTRAAPDPLAHALSVLRDGIPVAPDEDVITNLFADEVFDAQLHDYADLLEGNKTATDVGFAEKLRAACGLSDVEARFEETCAALFTLDGRLRVRKASDKTGKRLGKDGQERLLALHISIGEKLAHVRAMRVEQRIYRLNEAGLLCGVELLDRYQSIKRERGLIDYTDVEWKTRLLLTSSDYAEYMQYKLDARYRHILLDEFQDTNPLQWQIVKAWLEASESAQSQPTVFLVGDPKQSIYRFRRADPRLFDVARRYLRKAYGARALEQNVTRRNAPAVVSVVNSLFTGVAENFHPHLAYRSDLPGRVEVLPLAGHQTVSNGKPERWRNPLDQPRTDDTDLRRAAEARILAERIVEMVGHWQIADGEFARALRYQDIQVLVRRRSHLETYERALRHAQIPYVGSRLGGLLDTLEAGDLTALLQFLVVPFADIHLATALRSPVFSATDEDLIAVSGAEGGSWWQRLKRLVRDGCASAALTRAHALLNAWISAVDLTPVHDLLDRIYFEADVLQRYEAAVPTPMRAGVAANLRAFMEVALSTDSGRYPSLQGFLHEIENLRRATAEEAPDVGTIAEGADAVRILTVHGAKGLEAPVVWLVDASAGAGRQDHYDVLVDWPPDADAPGHFSLFSRKDEQGNSRDTLFEEHARLAARENVNLLYVAMTRAQQVFIASGSETPDQEQSWYRGIANALAASSDQDAMPVADEPAILSAAQPSEGRHHSDSLRQPLHIGNRTDDLVDPRRRHGTLVHALLEISVPPMGIDDRDFLRGSLNVSDAEFDSLWKAARSVIEEPSLSRFFDPSKYVNARNELAYVSADGELRRIDRLVEFADDIWVLDYKTGDAVDADNLEAAARPYRKQLEDYRVAISELMPGKPVRSALIFAGGLLYEV